MSIKSKLIRWTGPLVGAAALVACGGGSGGGDPIAQGTFLTSANQAAAAQEVVSTAFLPISGAQTLVGTQTVDEAVGFHLAFAELFKLPAYFSRARSGATLAGALITESYPCDVSGTLTVTANVANAAGGISAGDSAQITSNNCVMREGAISGSLGFTFGAVTGEFGSDVYSATVAMTYTNFTVSTGQFSGGVNGGLNLSVVANGLNSSTATMTAASMSMTGNYGGTARTRTVTNYIATVAKSPSNEYVYTTTTSVSGGVVSSVLGPQAITFTTVTPFVTRGMDLYPATGSTVISGSGNSKLRITALSNSQVQQELDANGDGTYESSTSVLWSSLI